METLISSWFADTGRLYLRYMIAGCAAIPAGIAYALLRARHINNGWYLGLVLVGGLGLAFWGYALSNRMFVSGTRPITLSATENGICVYGAGQRLATAAVVAYTCLVFYSGPRTTFQSGQQARNLSSTCIIIDIAL